MKSSVLLAAVLTLGVAAVASAQRGENSGMRFQGMDANGDGVITRQEWRGSDRAFRNQDWNGDGILSGDEVRPGAKRNSRRDDQPQDRERQDRRPQDRQPQDRFADLDANRDGRIARNEWRGSAAVFDALDVNRDGSLTRAEAIGNGNGDAPQDDFRSVDVNGDGFVALNEWHWNRAAFDRLDANRDARLSRQEWESTPQLVRPAESAAYKAGYDRGHHDGLQAGREDKPRGWDLDGQRELETADAGYQPAAGSRADYQSGYRAGFRVGYHEGFGR